MTTTAAAPAHTQPRTPRLDRPTAKRLAAAEYGRFIAQLRELAPADWSLPTVCTGWDVRAIAGHVLGMAEFAASPLEQARQLRIAKRRGGLVIDALTALQVEKNADRSVDELLARLDVIAPKAARRRARMPAPIRRFPMKGQPIDETGRQTETWRLGYLLDVILTRDTWMHRSDIALAVGRQMRCTPDHDGVLVADIAAEWASRHGEPCTLTLTGPAGGQWTWGAGGPTYELDAVEFCRILSGRGSGEGLLTTRVPF